MTEDAILRLLGVLGDGKGVLLEASGHVMDGVGSVNIRLQAFQIAQYGD